MKTEPKETPYYNRMYVHNTPHGDCCYLLSLETET